MQIRIRVIFPKVLNLPKSAKLTVELRDVSLADAASITLRSVEIAIDRTLETTVNIFDFNFPSKKEGNTHVNVWGHLSIDGSNETKQGDYLTTRAYPVGESDQLVKLVIQMDAI